VGHVVTMKTAYYMLSRQNKNYAKLEKETFKNIKQPFWQS